MRDLPDLDADRVFVVGHSVGGEFAPRVAAADPAMAGLVVPAGDTVPLHGRWWVVAR
ncbi:hypothetical protein AB0H42_02060 [Nocardia sp. NPDC050799]|uniref:hypothetical protein n=1 Tax=Nocardia sp. NPDC050799 TaxID=3154842 RepID=UPI0033F637CB